jgi:cell division protein FtsQ
MTGAAQGRALPGMGPGMPSASPAGEDEDFPRLSRQRFDDGPPRPWWRPASTTGRVFLSIAALIVLSGFTTAVLLLRNYLDHDARFRIDGSENIQATGLTEVSRDQMLPVFGEDIGRNIFFIPLAERRRQLEQIPWIEHATVMRFLPNQIRVAVVERQPVAFVRQGQQVGLVDASGVLLNMPPAMMTQHHYSFPVVTGIDARDTLASRKTRMAVYQRLLAELDSGGQRLSEQISEIDLTDPEDARVLMPEPGRDILAHFGEEKFLERYQRYKAHIAEWRQQYPNLAQVDLRYDRQVVLEMTAGAGGAQSAMAGAKVIDGLGGAKPPAGIPAEAAMNAAPATNASSQPQPAKTAAKHPSKTSAQAKAAAERARKKRAEEKRAELNAKKQKQHSAAGQGQ